MEFGTLPTPGDDAALHRMHGLQHELKECDGWKLELPVELVLERLSLPGDTPVDKLSGGRRRRVLRARVLVASSICSWSMSPPIHLDDPWKTERGGPDKASPSMIFAAAGLKSALRPCDQLCRTCFARPDRPSARHTLTLPPE